VRGVHVLGPGRVEVELTPTYTGCPALESMAADIKAVLGERGWQAEVSTVLSPAWSTDWISDEGRRKLAEFGIAPPGPVRKGPVLVELGLGVLAVRCPHCGSADTRLLSRFSSTACKALRSCGACGEPFEHIKEL
jgi:ring-1,2-phenylacetyl-CoA epoxidase subunit PaaD